MSIGTNPNVAKTPKTLVLTGDSVSYILCSVDSINPNCERYCKMSAKTVNYTPEQTLQMVADYQAGITVEKIAENMGKTVRSVVAKLSREKVYIAKTYVSKTGEKPVKKDVHADAIGAILRLPENDIESLTKANKSALKAIFEALANSKPI